MAEVKRIINAPADQIWAVLADGWTYSDWVVGSAHIRNVDPNWPDPGARLHHTSGMWPLLLSDVTVVRESEPPWLLVTQPRLWPLGQAVVVLRLAPVGGTQTRVSIAEQFDRGMLRLARNKINDLLLHRRNVETLRRLADLAVRRPQWQHAIASRERRAG